MATKKLDYEGLQTLVTVFKDYVRKHAGIPIGHEYFSVNPNIPKGSLPLFGGEYSRETYSDLWSWVQEQTGYLKTEVEWQEISSAHGGNVPFYSDGDGSTTFRVPSLKCWVKSANGTISEVGSYLEAGLPNITGTVSFQNAGAGWCQVYVADGAFYGSADPITNVIKGNGTETKTDGVYRNASFNASRSNAIYGKSSTVQPQSIVGLWLVKAYGTVIETGSIDEKQYIDDRIAAEITRADGKYLPLTGGTIDGQILLKSPTDRTVGFELTSLDPTSTYYKRNLDLGWDWNNRDGAGFFMRSSDDWPVNEAGVFGAYARNATQSCELKGHPDGTLTWGGHNVERVDTKSSSYIRYENGLQVLWGNVSPSNGYAIVTFPTPFVSTNYSIIPTGRPDANGAGSARVTTWSASNYSATSCILSIVYINGDIMGTAISYIAVGYWK